MKARRRVSYISLVRQDSPASGERAAALSEFLARFDEPCPACRYNLRGLRSTACPECGESLELHVNLVYPQLGLLVATVGGYWATLGASGALLVGMGVFSAAYGGGPGSVWLWVTPIVVFGLALGPAVMLSRRAGRSWLRGLGAFSRVAAACSGWALVTGGFSLFMWIVMTL